MSEFVKEYKLLKATTAQGLVNIIAEDLKNGWQPWGGVAIDSRPTIWQESIFYQAMVRKR